MEIKINTESLSALDREILRLVLGDNVAEAKPEPSKAPAAAREEGVGRRLQAARKAKPEPEPEPEPDEDVEPDVEDVDADEAADAEDEYDDVTIENAMELAQNMLRDGQRTKVVEALKAAGAKKVGELKGAQIAKFVKALSA